MLNAGIIGVTGYTGMELVRILRGHPHVRLTYATSRSLAGRRIGEAIQHLGDSEDLELSLFDAGKAVERAEIFFVCLPHGESMETVGQLRRRKKKVVDLSADFRLRDKESYSRWYGPHTQGDLLPEAVYGLPELNRDRIRTAELVANPGCYPTSVILGLAPLLKEKLVDDGTLVVDSKSGVSGAGREPAPGFHFPEVHGNFSAYRVAGSHRHIPEMEQELSLLAGVDVRITFTPHLLPVSRGILSTIYARPLRQLKGEELFRVIDRYYAEEPFIRVYGPEGSLPSLGDVRGTNMCHLGARVDERTGTVIVVSCIDNLVKGASGQAVQNMNLMMGYDESAGLVSTPLHP